MDTLDTAKRRIHPGLLLGVLLIGPFMAQADATIVNVAAPSVQAGLGASGPVLQLVTGGYLIAVAMLLITGARLGQAYGYRRAFVTGVSVFTLASLACGLASDPAVLVIARILQAGRLTAAVEPRYAADISGVSSTLIQVGGAIGVAAIGALYLAGTRGAGSHAPGPAAAAGTAHAFAVTTGVLAGVAVLAAAAAWRAGVPVPAEAARAERAPVTSFGPRIGTRS